MRREMEATEKQVEFQPERLTGKAFEKLLVEQHQVYRQNRQASVGRYGVQVSILGDDKTVVMQSLPDFEGVDAFGRQYIFDAKVCSQSSFGLAKYRFETRGARRRQLSHMLERSGYGVKCGFLIHWNARELKTRSEGVETFWFPVHPRMIFWKEFESGERKSINRKDCEEYGFRVNWSTKSRGTKLRPDWLAKFGV